MSRLLLPAAHLAMEAAWLGGVLGIWGRWLGSAHGSSLVPLWLVMFTLVAGHVAGSRWLRQPATSDQRRIPVVGTLALGVTWSVVSVWLTRHLGEGSGWIAGAASSLDRVLQGPTPDAGAVVAVLVLWWRGLHAGSEAPTYAATVRSFGIGVLALGTAVTIGAMGLGVPATSQAAIPVFLVAGLVALSAARLREAAQEVEAGASRGSSAQIERAWVRSTLPALAAVLVAGLLAALIVGDEAWRAALLSGIGAVWETGWRVLYWPLALVGVLAEWLVYLIQSLPHRPAAEVPEMSPPDISQLLAEASQGGGLPPAWNAVLRWLAAGLGTVLVVGVLYATSRVTWRTTPDREAEARLQRESLWSWRQVWRALLEWLRAKLRTRAGGEEGTVAGLRTAATVEAAGDARDVREAYRQMLALGRARGVAREPAATPAEYRLKWRDVLPGEDEVATLTEAYQLARYASPAAPHTSAGAARRALARLSARLAPPRSSRG